MYSYVNKVYYVYIIVCYTMYHVYAGRDYCRKCLGSSCDIIKLVDYGNGYASECFCDDGYMAADEEVRVIYVDGNGGKNCNQYMYQCTF